MLDSDIKQKNLVVDDSKELVFSVTKLLEYEGYEIYHAFDGIEALELLNDHPVDLILLDIMMPKMNGISALMKIRQSMKVPVIILSAKSEESDKVSGLSIGADDYVTKPYNTAELLARVKAQLRRYLVWREGTPENNNSQLCNGGLVLDRHTKLAIVDGEEIKLTAKEFKILELFMSNLGRVYAAEEVYEKVWREDATLTVENTVMVHIRRIREKIEIDSKNPKYLKVVWGIGYKMEQIKK